MYVLDTDVLSQLLKGRLPEAARARLGDIPADAVRTTAITLGELYYGAFKSAATARWLGLADRVSATIPRLAFEDEAARTYGDIRAKLERVGTPVADADLRIAAICIAGGHTLLSLNRKHFERVPGLTLFDWELPRT